MADPIDRRILSLRSLEKHLNEPNPEPHGAEQRHSFDTLPTEILLKIFEEQPYGDLKLRTSLVCSRFHNVLLKKSEVSYSRIDMTLFQDSPRRPHPGNITLNPILAPGKLFWRYSKSTSDVIFRNERSWSGFVRLVDAPVRLENACSPAVSEAILHETTPRGTRTWDVTIAGFGDGDSVTVLDIFERIAATVRDSVLGRPWKGVLRAESVDGVLHVYHN